MTSRQAKGFTLLELMIVVVIIAILASFAYYNYSRYAFRARRSEGQTFLKNLAADSTPNQYYTATAAAGATGDNQSYAVSAAPKAGGAQVGDTCGTLTLDNAGNQTASPGTTSNGNCW